MWNSLKHIDDLSIDISVNEVKGTTVVIINALQVEKISLNFFYLSFNEVKKNSYILT